MIFSTVTFILYFLAPLLMIYYLAPKKAKNYVLLGASLIFIACAGLRLFLIPIAAAAINYFLGMILGKRRIKPILAAGAAVNALLVIIFRLFMKQTDILWIAPDMLLFCGMCYGGMRAVSYLTDLYNGTTAIQTDPAAFGTYMLYFPLFASGPVVKYNDFRLLLERRKLTGVRFLSGAGLFICGLLKKLILADRLRTIWQAISGYDFTGLSLCDAWLGLIALGLYIYFMFTAFWDMGIGISRMLGIDAERRVHPVKYLKNAGISGLLRLAPLLAGFICVMTAMSLGRMGQYIAALFRFGYTGWGEQDFMYRFTSNLGLILLSIFVASGVVRFIVDALKPVKVKNSTFANVTALTLMALMIAAAAINLVSVAKSPSPEDAGSPLDGSLIRAADSRIAKSSFFTDRLFRFNNDIGYILGQKGMNGVHYAKDGSLIERPPAYDEAAVDRFIEDVDYIAEPERYNTYIAVIPPAFEHMKDQLRPYTYDDRAVKVKERVSYLLSDSSIKYFDCSAQLFGSTSSDRMYEYNSPDLTADGCYAVYEMLGDVLGYTPNLLSSYDRHAALERYRGRLWQKAGYDLAPYDTIEVLKLRNGTASESMDEENGVVIYNSDARNGRALLVIDDTVDTTSLIAEHFDTVHVFLFGSGGDLSAESAEHVKSYIGDKYFTDVLILCSTDTILNEGLRSLSQ